MKDKTHWLSSPNKNYLGHWDLPENEDLVLTIESAKFEEVKNPTNHKTEVKKVVRWVESYKPLICNQTNSKAIYKATGVRYMEDSEGKKVSLFISQVKDRRMDEMVDCVRIRHTKPKATVKKKESLSDERLQDAIKAIKKGSFTADEFKVKYNLTKAQIKTLDEALK